MFDWIFNIIKRMFTLFFDFMNTVELRDGVTFWSLLVVFIIGGSLASLVIRVVGGGGLASSAISTVKASQMDNYESYKQNRQRNESYNARYNAEHKRS